ncbi:MAG: spiro-SPASM protein [Spirochaetota bacterium]|nr:spiro-SPASM protein [Spirochaetota bacterium]
MKIIALLYLDDNISDKDLEFQGYYIPEKMEENLSALNEINDVNFCIPKGYSGKITDKSACIIRDKKDDAALWKEIFSNTGVDHIVKIFCDSPFLDIEIIKEMIDLHLKYLAEFTYSENLPSGFSCEIMSNELIKTLPDTIDGMLPLSQVIKSNINQFDVELYYKDPDIRDKRLAYRSGSPLDKRIMSNIYSKLGKIPKYSEIRDLINNNPELLYAGPSFVEVELTGRCDLDCIFCYRNTIKHRTTDIDIDLFEKILKDMNIFQLPYSICLGGSGEPMMHNNFYEIIETSLKESFVKDVVVETNGIYADNNYKNLLLNCTNNRIKTIFNINGLDNDTYLTIHNKDYFQRVFENITSIQDALKGKNSIYIQIMKINETEVFLDNYYDFWEKYNIPIILQKHNTYLGKIPDRRYSDLTPLERTPCWHLQRDVSILSDGRIIFCKQDIDGNYVKGRIQDESLYDLWKKSEHFFVDDYNGNYLTCPDCKSCDEWYTFNL